MSAVLGRCRESVPGCRQDASRAGRCARSRALTANGAYAISDDEEDIEFCAPAYVYHEDVGDSTKLRVKVC